MGRELAVRTSGLRAGRAQGRTLQVRWAELEAVMGRHDASRARLGGRASTEHGRGEARPGPGHGRGRDGAARARTGRGAVELGRGGAGRTSRAGAAEQGRPGSGGWAGVAVG
jgi:hypothetical protein